MDDAKKIILKYLVRKNYFGGKHTPEHKLLKSKTKRLNKKDKKYFEKEYGELINQELIIRERKRTKKGMDWHISLNPRKIKEIYMVLE